MPPSFRIARPRLQVPVLVRGATGLQLGLDPPAAVVLDVPDSDGLSRWMRHLDGTRTVAELTAAARTILSVPPVDGWLEQLLDRLEQHGLVADGPLRRTERWHRTRLRLIGAGPVAGRIADLLAAAGIGTLVLYDERPALVPGTAVSQADALRLRLARRRPDTRVNVVNHWSKPDSGVDLTVIVVETLECDRGLTDGLLRADQPHLLVRPAERGAVVGPAVRPGRSPCLHCLDLARRDLDPGWPELLPQLIRRRGQTGPVAQGWAAATATTQVLALLDGGDPDTLGPETPGSDSLGPDSLGPDSLDPDFLDPESLGATLELSEDDHLVRTRRWRAHPRCGCHWGQAAEWGP